MLQNLSLYVKAIGHFPVVSSEKYGAKCVSSMVSMGYNGLNVCENVLLPPFIEPKDWSSLCSNTDCHASFLKLILKKPYYVIMVRINQRLVDKSQLVRSIFLAMDDKLEDVYKLNGQITNILFEKDVGLGVKEILITPKNYYSGKAKNIGFNHIMVYSYVEGKIFFSFNFPLLSSLLISHIFFS